MTIHIDNLMTGIKPTKIVFLRGIRLSEAVEATFGESSAHDAEIITVFLIRTAAWS